jgi:predicted aspartyl protease
MNNRIEIKGKYTSRPLKFKKYPKHVGVPLIDIVLKNPTTGEIAQTTGEFMLDTGACISIINKKYQSFIEKMNPVDELNIQYGSEKIVKASTYKVIMIIKGKEIESTVAYDPDSPFLLLGHFDFFENKSYVLFDSTLKQYRIVKN